jgi:DNA-binding CsgD family transcriptional regulator
VWLNSLDDRQAATDHGPNARAIEGQSVRQTTPPTCRICGCTDADCRACVERTGAPCTWVEADLCSACRDLGALEALAGLTVREAVRRVETLTPREREVLALLAQGKPQVQIAQELGISPKTLDIHRANVVHKLQEQHITGVPRHYYLWRLYQPVEAAIARAAGGPPAEPSQAKTRQDHGGRAR